RIAGRTACVGPSRRSGRSTPSAFVPPGQPLLLGLWRAIAATMRWRFRPQRLKDTTDLTFCVCKDSYVATATHLITEDEAASHPSAEAVVVRFAGDSGDGMQLTGGQFTLSTALAGNDLATFPDFP